MKKKDNRMTLHELTEYSHVLLSLLNHDMITIDEYTAKQTWVRDTIRKGDYKRSEV